jgi:transposase
MKKKDCVGIDISKEEIDIRLFNSKLDGKFDNSPSGFKKMKSFTEKHVDQDTELLFCFEHTGLYAVPLQVYLEKEDMAYHMVSGLQVKRSLGIQRGKNDQVDARRLAEYAYSRREEIKPQKLQSQHLIRLKYLLSMRSRLVRQRAGFTASVKEYKKCLALANSDVMIHVQKEMIKILDKQVEALEKEIKAIIASEPRIKRLFDLASSVKGIGLISAAYMIVLTNCFTEFKTWRKFACYAGSAPFEHQSGTSIRGKTRISHYANKQIKAILTNAVKSAVQYSPEIRLYYQKKLKEGKHKKIVTNIIRNKLISRVFAAVRRGTPYVELVKYAA